MMDLDSAIQSFEDEMEKQTALGHPENIDNLEQMSEWLKELKASRECIERIRKACLCPGLRGDGFEEEIVEAMNEYLYDMGKEWEE